MSTEDIGGIFGFVFMVAGCAALAWMILFDDNGNA
jgi:hypothetical protein